MASFALAELILIGLLLSDIASKSHNIWLMLLRTLGLVLIVFAFYRLVQCDPGIESTSDAIINLTELSRYQK